MRKRFCAFLYCLFVVVLQINTAHAQSAAANRWADSVFQTLTDDERIAQLLVVRSSGMDAQGKPVVYDDKIDELVRKYNIGAICAFQGTPQQHAAMLNRIQGFAKTPIMVTVDAEWGLGMRFAGVQSFPYQLTLGALPDAELSYKVGEAIANQCRRMNIHVNYAPVVDINNNPANPVIGVRSFGEDKYKVALMGTRIMQGMQDKGVMACAKHFPGHGDVSVDSHYDLPVINKSRAALDSLELYPFQQLFKKGVGSVMVAHLYIPSIDTTTNQATSLSYKNITELMRNELGYKGLTFTDALEMKGVAKFYPGGDAAVQSLVAGNDMLCLPADVAQSIEAIKAAVQSGKLSWEQVHAKCKRVLVAKYDYVWGKTGQIDTTDLLKDLNAEVPELRRQVAEKALTVLALEDNFMPLVRKAKSRDTPASVTKKIRPTAGEVLYIALGANGNNELALRLKKDLNAKVISLPFNDSEALASFRAVSVKKYKKVIIGLHGIGRSPARNFGVPAKAISIADSIQEMNPNTVVLTFGNPYINQHFTASKNLVACYEDDSTFQDAAADWLTGELEASGSLPVTVGSFPFGSGIIKKKALKPGTVVDTDMDPLVLAGIDTIANEAIAARATPGCVVTAVRHGKIAFQKSYGYLNYDSTMPVSLETIYDLASVTKTSATTVAVMKLVEQGKIDIKKPIGDYLPWLQNSDKQNLLVENLLMHQAGLNAFIPFYKEVTDRSGAPLPSLLARYAHDSFSTPVTESMYLRSDWPDTMFHRIRSSKLTTGELKYVYSDNDFILLGKIVQAVTGQPLDQYVQDSFYIPMGMESTRFKAYEHFANNQIAPTENEKIFRQGLVWGYVHDPGAAMFGNVAGHAGLFSNANDLVKLYQMLLNGGEYEGKRYLQKKTIDWFSSYQTPISRRGLGFDKPEKDNYLRAIDKAYPSKSVSPLTYGHTGFTGICIWVDPQYDLIYLFLSNRVNPDGGDNSKISQLNIRSRIQEVLYKAIVDKKEL